jgi:hypothetical protein
LLINYKISSVRHLAWCLFSEPMANIPNIQALNIEPNQALLNWLSHLDQNPQPLNDYLDNHNRVLLGSYFECLWQFFFQFNPDWQLLGHHIQVIDGKQTMGELDILAHNRQLKRHYHIELAVKFYLRQPHKTGKQLQDWLGPQSHDQLDLKLNKLSQKQLPFLQHHATQAELIKRGLPSQPQQALALKGYLFEPWQAAEHHYHPSINPSTATTSWLHHSDLGALLEQCHSELTIQWALLPKTHWLGDYQHAQENDIQLLYTKEVQHIVDQHFTSAPYPFALMLVKLVRNTETLAEKERFMLVHNDWPKQVKAVKNKPIKK